ncbi:MAG TPA: choice-of-anchor J domain-containing protein [Candidatus Sulfomarinibacteraceae bacterium]|nr:choice-of-anchor J domain-containing protein [Candidatus Sulfomarinibacteraceae bacterium]
MARVWYRTIAIIVCAVLASGIGWADTGIKGGTPGGPAPVADPDDLSEGFDDITNLPGWFTQNNSDPIGTTDWFQGNDTVFPAHAGAPTAYIGANFNNTAGSLISNWLLTPELPLDNCGTMSFYTRTVAGSSWPDRLEVRFSQAGASTNVGTGYAGTGDFTNLIIQINPSLTVGGYPESWTEFTYDFSAASPATTGRIAFRCYVDDAGPVGNNSNYIGIDTFTYTDGTGCGTGGGGGGGGGTGGVANPVPTLSSAGVVVLVLALIAISVVLIRRRM